MTLPDDAFERLADQDDSSPSELRAPGSLKSRIYTALVKSQSAEAPLRPLTETLAEGRRLCVFEQLVQIAPAGQKAESVFYCQVCHARVLAEHFDNPPIYWPNCPYVGFKTP
jgi:hypothetical protein